MISISSNHSKDGGSPKRTTFRFNKAPFLRFVVWSVAFLMVSLQQLRSFASVNFYSASNALEKERRRERRRGSQSNWQDKAWKYIVDMRKGQRYSIYMGKSAQNAEESSQNLDSKEEPQIKASTATFDPTPIDSTAIREWGCARNETPLIFVHIGKAGGGGVRARIAASALEYARGEKWWRVGDDETYYYPVYDNGRLYKGKLSNSGMNNFLPIDKGREAELPFRKTFKYEGMAPCHATTPLGQAITCPLEKEICKSHRNTTSNDQDVASKNRCDTVYMGHNLFGSELHWLPTQYLSKWWNSTQWAKEDTDRSIATKLYHRDRHDHLIHDPSMTRPRKRFCPNGKYKFRDYWKYYKTCLLPDQAATDALAIQTLDHQRPTQKQQHYDSTALLPWSQLYASMPVLRVTMLREPFSWMMSRFFWHTEHIGQNNTGIVKAFQGKAYKMFMRRHIRQQQKEVEKNNNSNRNSTNERNKLEALQAYDAIPDVLCDDIEEAVFGHANRAALEYIFYLCGEHCLAQYVALDQDPKQQVQYIDIMERQAAYNLRNSFAVVGLLQETDIFYDMISRRVSYMDMSLNLHVQGERHSAGNGGEIKRCKALYQDKSFQELLERRSPAIAAVNRLYQIGVEVNGFQRNELQKCSYATISI